MRRCAISVILILQLLSGTLCQQYYQTGEFTFAFPRALDASPSPAGWLAIDCNGSYKGNATIWQQLSGIFPSSRASSPHLLRSLYSDPLLFHFIICEFFLTLADGTWRLMYSSALSGSSSGYYAVACSIDGYNAVICSDFGCQIFAFDGGTISQDIFSLPYRSSLPSSMAICKRCQCSAYGTYC